MKSVPEKPAPEKMVFDVQVTEENFHRIYERVSQVVNFVEMSHSKMGNWCCKLRATILIRGKECHIIGLSFNQSTACDALTDAMQHFIKRYRYECRFEPEEYPELKIVK